MGNYPITFFCIFYSSFVEILAYLKFQYNNFNNSIAMSQIDFLNFKVYEIVYNVFSILLRKCYSREHLEKSSNTHVQRFVLRRTIVCPQTLDADRVCKN